MDKSSKDTHYSYYNTNLKSNASKLRKDMTKAEACLWKYVLKSQQLGFNFKRQRPIDIYIADFICLELKLIIEVDGITHHFENTYKNDIIRQKRLESLGFKVLRFQDDEVLTNIEGVRDFILMEIDRIK